jgi:class 3 adenylate cyclase
MKTYWHYFKKFFQTVDLNFRAEFRQELIGINKTRLLYSSYIVLFLSPLLYFFDYSIQLDGICDKVANYCGSLMFFHILLTSMAAFYLPLYRFYLKKASYIPSKRVILFYIWIYSLSCTSIAILDQLWTGTISVFLLIVFSIATMFLLTRTQGLTIILSNLAYFILGMIFFQADTSLRLANILNGTVLVLLATTVFLTFYQFRVNDYAQKILIRQKNEELQDAKVKIEDLLKNVLPETIISEINLNGFSKPSLREKATIVFTDFVSFSKNSEHIDPILLVDTLNDIYQAYDDIMKNHSLEKLKTIGDSYMYAGGLFSDSYQLVESCDAAFDMLEYLEEKRTELLAATNYDWSMRVGIHIGPTITGVIGKWRFLYDTWGTTVNLASRLEAHSEPNYINVSEDVVKKLKELTTKFKYKYRGEFPIKNMGSVKMYFIEKS